MWRSIFAKVLALVVTVLPMSVSCSEARSEQMVATQASLEQAERKSATAPKGFEEVKALVDRPAKSKPANDEAPQGNSSWNEVLKLHSDFKQILARARGASSEGCVSDGFDLIRQGHVVAVKLQKATTDFYTADRDLKERMAKELNRLLESKRASAAEITAMIPGLTHELEGYKAKREQIIAEARIADMLESGEREAKKIDKLIGKTSEHLQMLRKAQEENAKVIRDLEEAGRLNKIGTDLVAKLRDLATMQGLANEIALDSLEARLLLICVDEDPPSLPFALTEGDSSPTSNPERAMNARPRR